MQNILNKRIWRDFKQNYLKFLSIIILIIASIYLIISLSGSAKVVIDTVLENNIISNLEDGQFQMYTPLKESEIEYLKDKKVDIEEAFNIEFNLVDDSVIRIFKNREQNNLVRLETGILPKKDNEIVIEKLYAQNHNINIDDKITIADREFIVVGIGTVPDYDYPLKNISDTVSDSKKFALGFVTDSCFEELKSDKNLAKAVEYLYSYKNNGEMKVKEIKEHLKNIKIEIFPQNSETKPLNLSTLPPNLVRFLQKEDNPRINASLEDVEITDRASVIAGIIIIILLSYVISVFVIQGVEAEASVIGTLSALGVNKNELALHYIKLPMFITLLGGIIGTYLGFGKYGLDYQALEIYTLYSLPSYVKTYPLFLIIYGAVMPPVIASFVNYFVIIKKLSQPALKLIRNEQKVEPVSNINLGNISFISKFQIRQMLREKRIAITIIFGLFISLLVMMLGFNVYMSTNNLSTKNKADIRCDYMYILKKMPNDIPNNAEIGYYKSFSKENLGFKHNINLLGFEKDNKYYNYNLKKGKNVVTISDAVASKFNLKIGDILVLNDEVNDVYYALKIDEIVPYSIGLYAFMDIDSMRELLQQNKDYYNVLLVDKELDIDSRLIYSTTTRSDISKASDVFKENMQSMYTIMISVSFVLFAIIMYLMIKVAIDRSSFNISLMKVFGFSDREISRLYVDGNFLIIALGALICVPIAKYVIDKIYAHLIANVSAGMDAAYPKNVYMFIFGGIFVSYFAVSILLVRKIKNIPLAEILKTRE